MKISGYYMKYIGKYLRAEILLNDEFMTETLFVDNICFIKIPLYTAKLYKAQIYDMSN